MFMGLVVLIQYMEDSFKAVQFKDNPNRETHRCALISNSKSPIDRVIRPFLLLFILYQIGLFLYLIKEFYTSSLAVFFSVIIPYALFFAWNFIVLFVLFANLSPSHRTFQTSTYSQDITYTFDCASFSSKTTVEFFQAALYICLILMIAQILLLNYLFYFEHQAPKK
jgi:hypothetical protein